MRMYLKNNSINIKEKNKLKLKKLNIKNIKFSSKNLFIFLVSLSIIAIIIGIIFYYLISGEDKTAINNILENNFKITDTYDYINLLKENILKNTYNSFLIWILGLSVIGIIACIFIYFCEMFSIGFTIASIIETYKAKGIIGAIIYLFPSKICYIIVMFFLTFYSIKISYKIIKLFFTKEEINIKKEISKYFKVIVFTFFTMIGISMLSVFIDPLLIKLFTKL